MNVEIFRNTVKRRGKGASFEMIKAWAEGIKAAGDNAIWIEGDGDPERWTGNPKNKVAVHFGYGPDSAGDFLKGARCVAADRDALRLVPCGAPALCRTAPGRRADAPRVRLRLDHVEPACEHDSACSSRVHVVAGARKKMNSANRRDRLVRELSC